MYYKIIRTALEKKTNYISFYVINVFKQVHSLCYDYVVVILETYNLRISTNVVIYVIDLESF